MGPQLRLLESKTGLAMGASLSISGQPFDLGARRVHFASLLLTPLMEDIVTSGT